PICSASLGERRRLWKDFVPLGVRQYGHAVTFAAFSFGGRELRRAMALPRDGVENAVCWPLRF
ncbi:MAG: hypothetical protein J6A23_01060, partial [Thermoguttaceae bacterium]|nr:hypothetical protein [Thermoguttaceae bacterium]